MKGLFSRMMWSGQQDTSQRSTEVKLSGLSEHEQFLIHLSFISPTRGKNAEACIKADFYRLFISHKNDTKTNTYQQCRNPSSSSSARKQLVYFKKSKTIPLYHIYGLDKDTAGLSPLDFLPLNL